MLGERNQLQEITQTVCDFIHTTFSKGQKLSWQATDQYCLALKAEEGKTIVKHCVERIW